VDFESCDKYKYNFNATTQTLLYITVGGNRPTFGREFDKNKEWVKHDIANILVGQSKEFDDLFDLEKEMPKNDRLKLLWVDFSGRTFNG